MDVRPATTAAEPDDPTRKEFRLYRQLLGATVLGAGMAVSACNRTMGAIRSNATPVAPPSRTIGLIATNPTKPAPPHCLPGRGRVLPKSEPPPREPDAAPLPGVPPAR